MKRHAIEDEIDRDALMRMFPGWMTDRCYFHSDDKTRGHKKGPHGCYAPGNQYTGEIRWR